MADLDLSDIQGYILRGYTMPAVRHFLLRVDDAAGARRFLGGLASGDPAASPQITTAQPWSVKPDFCLNVGITYEGLQALALPAATLSSFPAEFRTGPVGRAGYVGDTGDSAPARWDPPFGTPEVHVLLNLYGASREIVEAQTAVLQSLFQRDGAMTEVGRRDGYELPDGKVHFGYRDGISQPNIEGAPGRKMPDMQPVAPTGEFLLGYPSQFVNFTYPVPQPVELGHNGSFVAFRVLKQDVAGFERFLQENAPKVGMDPEKLAAKMCGRWRNGVPIALSPDTDSPQPPLTPDQYNGFDYVPSPDYPDVFNDKKGYRCPIGAHLRVVIRRTDLDTIRSLVAANARELTDAAGPAGRLDITAGFARALPLRLAGQYFGVPGPDPQTLSAWTRTIFIELFLNLNQDPQIAAAGARAGQEFRSYIEGLIAQARAEPQGAGKDDVLHRMLAAQASPATSLSDDRLRDNLIGLLVGMIDNTEMGVVNAIDVLLRNPAKLQAAVAAARASDPGLLLPYVQEALRFRPPAPVLVRLTTQDYVLAKGTDRATSLPAGKVVFAANGSAMMDETELDAPAEFREGRPDYQYLLFGWGMHRCFGKYISQVQITEIVRSLLVLDNLRRAPGAEGELHYEGFFPKSFTVEFG